MFDEYFAMRSTLWALLVLGACTKPNPASCLDDFCDDPALPFCDADGAIGGVPDTCIAVQCTPDEFQGCRDDRALICSADGQNINELACEFGCGDEGCLPCNTADCQPPEKHIIPKYLQTVCDDLATTALTVTEDLTINTSDDVMCGAIVEQPLGPPICVLHHTSISLAQNRIVRVIGTRALAMVADRDFDLVGILDASAGDDFTNGPGGGFKKSGGGGGTVGGGGAGNRTRGGHGGTTNTDGGALNGGAAEPNPVGATTLFGAPQANPSGGAKPGGAGGGVTLISCRGTLSIAGLVDVNGGGGQASVGGVASGGGPVPPILPPGGGGAGGNLILQGMRVVVEGQIFANGGGGGSGGTPFDGRSNGQRGQRDVICATGGPSQQGDGGFGGCISMAPTDGQGATSNSSTGGGGGSAGFLLTYTPQGVTPMLTPLAVSPAFEPNGVIPTN